MEPETFDPLAADYDQQFTHTRIGRMMREAVWARCAARFAPGSRVLEMNCGTGEDALWLAQQGIEVLATDVSPAMLQIAQRKLAAADAAMMRVRFSQVCAPQFRCLAWERLHTLEAAGFDGALSNFGGLNCVADLSRAAPALADKLRPGAVAVLCIMGPLVPWEWLWFVRRAEWGRAFRRLRGTARWRGIEVHYHSISATRRAFAPYFRLLRLAAIGALLPPPYTEASWVGKEGTLRRLQRLERAAGRCWPLPQLADHYLMELRRR
ncbi:MAG: class I SAM-dependent methyltransferase [Sinobacteraceae bacterium]|nr:class I SAM-dependent methyltransferase [Nevskiaceae bacterium]